MTKTTPTVHTPASVDNTSQQEDARAQDKANTKAAPAAVPEKTFGEKKFDSRYYGTLGFWANLGLSSLITYFVNENSKGAGLKKLLDTNFYKNTLGIKHVQTRDILTKASTLLMGGHITAVAIYFGEKDKSAKVRKWDEQHYGPDAESDPTIQAAHERVDAEGKVTGLGMATSRMICWGAIQAVAGVAGNKDSNLLKNWAEKRKLPKTEYYSVERPSEMAGTFVAKITPGFIKKPATAVLGVIADKDKKEGVYQKVVEYAAMDTIYTKLTAWMLKPTTQFMVNHISFFRKSTANTETKPLAKTGGYVGTSTTDLSLENREDSVKETSIPSPTSLVSDRAYMQPVTAAAEHRIA